MSKSLDCHVLEKFDHSIKKTKIMTILGTRPKIIRLSLIIPLLDRFSDHTLVHTGQNYTESLSDIFFRDLGLRQPDEYLGVRGNSFGEQIGQILSKIEQMFYKYRPDRILILGDTNSGLTAIIARRLGIPVFHMEAGNRCFDDRVPEEVNRRVIDHSSTVLLPYTNRSKDNLVREGIPENRIYVTGNPIYEIINKFDDSNGEIFQKLQIKSQKYFLVTIHRAENVDIPERLESFVQAFEKLYKKYQLPVIISTHPRTRSKLNHPVPSADDHKPAYLNHPVPSADDHKPAYLNHSEQNKEGINWIEPLGFLDFLYLEKHAFCVLTDSGTVQEETCILNVPNVTLRDVTERPETLETGSNILSGANVDEILNCVDMAVNLEHNWSPPAEYLQKNVSETVVKILLSHRIEDLAEIKWKKSQ